jgi:hypothetical protein
VALYRAARLAYDRVSMRNALAAALLVLVGPLVPAAVAAPKKAPAAPAAPAMPVSKGPSACGVKPLPLVVGNTWTYGTVAAPLPAPDAIARIAPIEPKEVVITVKSIDAKKGADTTVTLEEKITTDLSKDPKKPQLDQRTITTTIVCNATKFDISPDSFFFAGEPGGYVGLTLDKIERKGTSWKLTGGKIGDAEWREDVSIQWTRPAAPGSPEKAQTGKLDLERIYTPSQPDSVITKLGNYPKADKTFLKTTGRVTLADAPADMKPSELPDNWVTTFWTVDGVGIVQALNSYAHEYQLVDAKLN